MSVIAKLRRNSLAAPRDVLAGIAEGLVRKIPALAPGTARGIAEALHDLLDGHDETSRNLRVGMQHYLIEIAELQRRPAQQHREPMLTTEAAAELMQCSRPYVAMLIDNGKLTGASVTEGGHRRVPESSVRAWIKDRETLAAKSNYRAAAEQAGMYEIPDTAFIEPDSGQRS